MNWKKLILFGALLYIVMFVVVSIAMFIPGVGGTIWESVISWITSAVLGFMLIKKYCSCKQGNECECNFGKGLLAGLAMLVVASILDVAITVPVFIKSYAGFYSDWTLWAGFAVFLVFAGIGACKCSCKTCKPEGEKSQSEIKPGPKMEEKRESESNQKEDSDKSEQKPEVEMPAESAEEKKEEEK